MQSSVYMKAAKNRLRVMRAEKRMTQMSVATKAKMHPSRLSYIENGHVEPSGMERAAIARALRVPVHEIFPSEVTA